MPKLIATSESFTSIPVPDNVTICGLPFASSVTERFPVASPFCTGVNFTWIWQFVPTARLEGQLFVSVNGPVVEILEMFTGTVPVLVSVAVLGELVVPIKRKGNFRFEGVSVTVETAPNPLSDTDTVCGLPGPW